MCIHTRIAASGARLTADWRGTQLSASAARPSSGTTSCDPGAALKSSAERASVPAA